MNTAIVCIALLALLIFVLGLAVSLTRGSTKRSFGYAEDPTDRLHKLCRAHANAAEYAPILGLLTLALAIRGEPAAWLLWTMIFATAFRYVHAAGMIAMPTLARPNPLRFIGALGTYVCGIVLAGALLVAL